MYHFGFQSCGNVTYKRGKYMFDTTIIGTGPADLSAALNLRLHGKSIIWFGSKELSQLRIIRTLSSLRMCSDLLFISNIVTVRIFMSSGGFCYFKIKFAPQAKKLTVWGMDFIFLI